MSAGLGRPKTKLEVSKLESSLAIYDVSTFDFRIFEFGAFLPLAACALSGLLLVACFPKIHLRGLVWVACLPLLAALAGEKRLKHAFLLGYVCGAVFFAGSCYWFMTVMEFYGHLAPALAVVVLILFVIIDSTFFGGFGLAMGWAARRSSGWALAAEPVSLDGDGIGSNLSDHGISVEPSGVRRAGTRRAADCLGDRRVWPFVPGRGHQRLAGMGVALRTARARRTGAGGWVALLLLAQWRLAPPPPAMGKELALLVQPNVPLDDAELDAWIPWRDPTQLQQLVQFSVTAVEQFFPDHVAPGFSPASGDAG